LEILYGAKTVFTHSAITPPKVNRFGCNLEQCEPNVGVWPWQILCVIRAVATVWEGSFFWKDAKIAHKISRSCGFRPSYLRNENRSPHTHG